MNNIRLLFQPGRCGVDTLSLTDPLSFPVRAARHISAMFKAENNEKSANDFQQKVSYIFCPTIYAHFLKLQHVFPFLHVVSVRRPSFSHK